MLIPSLIIMFVMAKRWGHIDIYLIIIDGLIFTALGFVTGPWIGTTMLVAWISSVWLYWMRRDRQGQGIFLGYSYLVSLMLILGGAFAIGGFATMFPWNAYARWTAAREASISTTVERARDRALLRDRRLVLNGATLDFENTVHRQKFGGVWQFAAKKKLASEAQEAWVPVKGDRGAFWVRFPEGVEPTGKESAAGYYVGNIEEFSGPGAATTGLSGSAHGRVLYQQATAAYVDEQLIFPQMRATVAWKNGLWFAAGLLILGGAVWRAREE